MLNTTQTLDTIGIFKSVASAIKGGITAVEVVNEKAKTLKTSGIVFGKSVKTCQYRVQFADAMKEAFKGKAAKTYANYMTSFVLAVNDGTAFSLSSSKGKAKGGKGKTKTEAIDKVIAKVFSHTEFGAFCAKIQESYDNAEAPTIEGCVRSYLESEGYEITE
jgi:hypothetical protein